MKWTDVRSEKAAWHLKLAQLIANELRREIFGDSNGLACTTRKELMRWIIDSGSGFDLISGQSLTENDRRMITRTNYPCRMATANGITTADEQLSVHINGIDSTVDAVILDNSPCNVLSLGKLCMEKGFGFEWKLGEFPKLWLPDGTVRVLMVDQHVPMLASASPPEKIDEANSQDRTAPLNAGGEESTSVDDVDLSKKTPPSGAEGNFSQRQHVPNPTLDSTVLRRRKNTRCSTNDDDENYSRGLVGELMP